MKPIICFLRSALLSALFLVMVIGVFSEPEESSPTWIADFLFSKAIAALSFYALYRLYNLWRKTDKWLSAYDKACDNAIEAPNHGYLGKEEEEL